MSSSLSAHSTEAWHLDPLPSGGDYAYLFAHCHWNLGRRGERPFDLIGGLPGDLDAPVYIARHVAPTRESLLPQILSREGTLTVAPFQSGAQLLPGQLFVAPAGHHLLIEHTQVNVLQQRPNRPRNDIDRLFQSAAASYGSRLIAVILTGMLTDGTAGLQTVKQQGGTTIIQDPEEAAFPSMPQSAQAQCAIDYCLPLAHIALLLPRLLGEMASQRS